ncbi:glycoside hydrolase family 15 protein [Desertivirga brevis]|uniref:glycoside hydrolase family 15 protein n=1 Tax=Desertivirga brevis TaxID=2810310 RepID=UPI001A96AC0C|nr:glycoside hydrolase family 15 protein [Pedobacter sp. SYSU D00873]
MSYQPIENYAIIGDLNTVALVGLDGSIDFMCFPNFDSPTVFAAILDENKGGSFKIFPDTKDLKLKQLYLPDTNILITRFLSKDGVAELTDFMPVEELYGGKELIRRVTCIKGDFTFHLRCAPRFDYARAGCTIEQISDYEVLFKSNGTDNTCIRLKATVPLVIEDRDVVAVFKLEKGQKADFLFEQHEFGPARDINMESFITQSLFDTIKFWKDWVTKSNYRGRWMEIVNRSALCLKLMTSYHYGSMVAAPTFGLPEEIGGVRNWDYRYTWIRDASFTIYTLLKLGYRREARDFINWIEKQCKEIAEHNEYLSLMYALDGEKELTEINLDHLEGYKKSSPVRIGNAAYTQIQLDIYGELLDSVYLYDKNVEPIAYRFWKDLTRHVDWVCNNWQRSDEGIWEVRGGKKEFLYSRMMCWVAIDRGIKIAQKHSYPLPSNWVPERDNIFNSIHKDFWNEELQAFVQYKGAKTVDAATLLMPIIRFISPKDPQWLSTLKLIEEELVSDFLVYRYRPNEAFDGLTGGEGTFSMCTFWYVECLAMAGELTKARLYFEKMLGYANHVGLYAEMLGLQGEHLGNFPQAFTHLGLISAALHLDKQLDDQRNREIYNNSKSGLDSI